MRTEMSPGSSGQVGGRKCREESNEYKFEDEKIPELGDLGWKFRVSGQGRDEEQMVRIYIFRRRIK